MITEKMKNKAPKTNIAAAKRMIQAHLLSNSNSNNQKHI